MSRAILERDRHFSPRYGKPPARTVTRCSAAPFVRVRTVPVRGVRSSRVGARAAGGLAAVTRQPGKIVSPARRRLLPEGLDPGLDLPGEALPEVLSVPGPGGAAEELLELRRQFGAGHRAQGGHLPRHERRRGPRVPFPGPGSPFPCPCLPRAAWRARQGTYTLSLVHKARGIRELRQAPKPPDWGWFISFLGGSRSARRRATIAEEMVSTTSALLSRVRSSAPSRASLLNLAHSGPRLGSFIPEMKTPHGRPTWDTPRENRGTSVVPLGRGRWGS